MLHSKKRNEEVFLGRSMTQNVRLHGLFFVLVAGFLRSGAHALENDLVPPWQSVVAYGEPTDRTGSMVIPLFGKDGPEWTVSSGTDHDDDAVLLPATVPGDVVTDLLRDGRIEDPYFGNHLWSPSQRRVWIGTTTAPTNSTLEQRTRTWTYTTQIRALDFASSRCTLVLESIKMGATVSWNGVPIATVTNQFLRYRIPIPPRALGGGQQQYQHTLTLSFDPSIPTHGRYMASSGGWDWAPYANVGDGSGSRAWTFGIVEPLYLVASRSTHTVATITEVVPLVHYHGPYARERLRNPQHQFVVSTTVSVDVSSSILQLSNHSYGIRIKSNFTDTIGYIPLRANQTEYTIDLVPSAVGVDLWWPRGYGEQPLYVINVSIVRRNSDTILGPTIQRPVAFRTLAQVTANDTDDTIVHDMISNQTEGSGEHGMFLRSNGVPIHSRGANVIPMDQLEGRLSSTAAMQMVHAAAHASMNMLRVWGGGSVPPAEFYDACDALGIMVYQDLMFVEEQEHGAAATPVVKEEIAHIVRKLAAHPSIVLWNGCNECGYSSKSMDIYASFVMQTVATIDTTRPIWPSSPSAFGWATGVARLTGMPNGRPLLLKKQKRGHVLEDHGPYQRSYSLEYPAVNGRSAWNSNETLVPPKWKKDTMHGPGFPNTFTSEFGASVVSSFESMSTTLPETAWALHGGAASDECVHKKGNENTCSGSNLMAQRYV